MTSRTQRILTAALRGGRRGALVGFALPFVTGSAFSVVTQDVKFIWVTVAHNSQTVILWSTVWFVAVVVCTIHAGISAAAEIKRIKEVESEYERMMSESSNHNKV